MKIKKLALTAGLGLSLIASSCSLFKGKKPELLIIRASEKGSAVKNLTPVHKMYYANIDKDEALERIVIKSKLFRVASEEPRDYSNIVEIYVLRGVPFRQYSLDKGGVEKLIGEGKYTLKRVFSWRGGPITEESVIFLDNGLKAGDKEIVYYKPVDNFYFKEDFEERLVRMKKKGQG